MLKNKGSKYQYGEYSLQMLSIPHVSFLCESLRFNEHKSDINSSRQKKVGEHFYPLKHIVADLKVYSKTSKGMNNVNELN